MAPAYANLPFGACMPFMGSLWMLDTQIMRQNHSSALNMQLGRQGQVVIFLKARREVGLLYGFLADRKQCRNEYFSKKRL